MEVVRTFAGHQLTIFAEYSALQDYLWKSPQFADREAATEQRKLFEYFPDCGSEEERATNHNLRNIRASFETPKILHWFPQHISNANLFLTASWFEKHLQHIAIYLDQIAASPLAKAKGNGIQRYFDFFKSNSCNPHDFPFHGEIINAVYIRNALLHASGNLSLSKNASHLKIS